MDAAKRARAVRLASRLSHEDASLIGEWIAEALVGGSPVSALAANPLDVAANIVKQHADRLTIAAIDAIGTHITSRARAPRVVGGKRTGAQTTRKALERDERVRAEFHKLPPKFQKPRSTAAIARIAAKLPDLTPGQIEESLRRVSGGPRPTKK
jgi:hypothetical protein